MIAWGVSIEQLEQAATAAKVRLYDPRPDGRGIRFTLKTIAAPRRKAPWRRHRKRCDYRGVYRTVPGAVCWHGHRRFFERLFEIAPDARVKTGYGRTRADYRGAQDFETSHEATKTRPHFNELAYHQACFCEE